MTTEVPKEPLPTTTTGSLIQRRQKIYPRLVKGVFNNWRIAMVVLILFVFYALVWVNWGHRPAVLLDLGARRFYFFGTVFWPQDVIYVTALLILAAYALFLFTAIAGRLFCGYACPQTVYTELLMWIERWIEGDRNARIKLDAAPWSASKIAKKTAKHVIWLAVAVWSGLTFVGYFVPIREVLPLVPFGLSGWLLFWVFLFSALVYLLAGIMREQVCKYMCPYARFQSVMLDRDSMVVTYDNQRGEPRGVPRKNADPAVKLGDCIDCSLCVHVCPTGIDIRKGLQYECIGCGACIDACDTVMIKQNKPVGLVRYSTENAMEKGYTRKQQWARVLRFRTLTYIVIMFGVTIAVAVALFNRNPLRVDVLRDRHVMAREVTPGVIENVYQLQIMNTEEVPHTFSISVQAAGLPGVEVALPGEPVAMAAEEARKVPVSVRLKLPREGIPDGVYPLTFTVRAVDDGGHSRSEESTFMVPRN